MKKSLLTISNLSDGSLDKIIELAHDVKANPAKYHDSLRRKTIGLIFEKPSTRTRVSFSAGICQLGGDVFELAPSQIEPGKRESLKDIARTISRYLDALVLRTHSHATIEEVDDYATIPVINGLSDMSHPCQALADYLTVVEHCKDKENITVAYVGDGNNVLSSLMLVMLRKGINVSVATPAAYAPDPEFVELGKKFAAQSGAQLSIMIDPKEAVKNADIIYTDVWISMGEEETGKDPKDFAPYQINAALVACAKPEVKVMHCLPAHRGEEITDEVMEAPYSVVFDQAENRMHAQKAVLLHALT